MNESISREARQARTHAGRAIVRFVAVGVLAVACAACDALESKTCHAMACVNSVTIKLDISLSPTEFNGSRLEVCRNDRCGAFAVRVISTSETRPDQQRQVICDPLSEGGGAVECGSTLVTPDSGIRVNVSYSVASPHDFTDGDRFRLRITDPSASVVFAQKEGTVARYETMHPNGADCDGDYFCRYGTL